MRRQLFYFLWDFLWPNTLAWWLILIAALDDPIFRSNRAVNRQ